MNTSTLSKELKKARFTNRIRSRSYSGGSVSGRLMDFRSGEYRCQVDLHENGRQCIIVGPIATGVPQGGWISGDWIAFGKNPKSCPELGTAFERVSLAGIECGFRHKLVSNMVADCFAKQAELALWLTKEGLKANELLVITPDHVILNLRDRDEFAIADAFGELRQLATRFSLIVD